MDRSLDDLVKQLLADQNYSKDFTIRATTIPDGAMKGKIVIEAVAKSGFRLLDLPRELRERIYTLVFGGVTEVDIRTYQPAHKQSELKLVSGSDFRNKRKHPGQTWSPTLSKWVGGPSSEFSLLRANKQIHAEATPVAYRSRRFVFSDHISTRLPMFINQIGSSVKHLGEIELGDRNRWYSAEDLTLLQLKSMLTNLEGATGLRNLHLVPDRLVLRSAKKRAKDSEDPDSWACAFNRVVTSFLLDLRKSYKASKRSWKAADVIQFVNTRAMLHTATTAQERQQLAQFEATFREIARGYLEG